MESKYSTEVTIAGSASSSPFSVTQPGTITGHRDELVTLNCSYSRDKKNDVLGVNIYWRVGNITGPYAYHPYKEMVHPSYRGRTGIEGSADLHIRGIQRSDDSTYYCFVMLRLCNTGKLVQYGEGTRLIVTDPGFVLVMIISASAVAMLVLLCLVLVVLKRIGVICKKKNVSVKMKTCDNPENEDLPLEERPYCEISPKNTEHEAKECKEEAKDEAIEREREEPDNENIVYAQVNKTKLQQRNLASSREEGEQTVYAAVRK
ncbi:uncharacterized protein LOC142204417 [Leptodactylus fuscus]|uniref:uncharacterized protein LOC142204417 n=1 Tax=Leptodactylus fuscus TaxID=238119 RepID=UPI003F4E861B